MPWVGFEPTISTGERPKTYALDRAATGTGRLYVVNKIENQAMKMLAHRSTFLETLVFTHQTVEEHDMKFRRPEDLINFCSRMTFLKDLNGGDI